MGLVHDADPRLFDRLHAALRAGSRLPDCQSPGRSAARRDADAGLRRTVQTPSFQRLPALPVVGSRLARAFSVVVVHLVGAGAGADGRLWPGNGAVPAPGGWAAVGVVVGRRRASPRARPVVWLGRHVRARHRAVFPAAPAGLPAAGPVGRPPGGLAAGRWSDAPGALPADRRSARAERFSGCRRSRTGAVRFAGAGRGRPGGRRSRSRGAARTAAGESAPGWWR